MLYQHIFNQILQKVRYVDNRLTKVQLFDDIW